MQRLRRIAMGDQVLLRVPGERGTLMARAADTPAGEIARGRGGFLRNEQDTPYITDPTVNSVASANDSVATRVSVGSARFQTKTAATRIAQASVTRPSQTQRSTRRGSSIP